MPQRLLAALKAAPLFWTVFAALTVAVVVPFWRVDYLPFLDAPQHLATIDVIHRASAPEVAALYTVDLASTQYLLYYVTTDVLAYAVGVENANKVFLSLYAALLPLSLLYALVGLGRAKVAALLAFPLVFNRFLFYGFINYLFAFPLLFFAIGLLARRGPEWRWRAELALAGLAVLSFYSHLQIFLVHVGAVGLFALARWRGLRLALRELSHLAPALVLFGVWLALSAGLAGGDAWESDVSRRYATLDKAQWEPLHETFSQAHTRLLSTYWDAWDERLTAALLVGLGLLIAIRGLGVPAASWRDLAPEALTLFVLLCYLCLPTSYRWIWPVNWRFLPLAVLCGLLWGRAQLPRVAHGAFTLLFGAVAAGAIALHVQRFDAFDAEAREFDGVLAKLAPGSRCLSVIFDSGSAVVEGPVYLHFGQYHAVRNAGLAVYSFAEAPQSPIRFVPRPQGGPPPTVLRSEWKPNEFRFNTDNRYYDHFLVRGAPAGFARRVGFGDEVQQVFSTGKWTLYHYPRGAAPG